jgi:hypothetical protein
MFGRLSKFTERVIFRTLLRTQQEVQADSFILGFAGIGTGIYVCTFDRLRYPDNYANKSILEYLIDSSVKTILYGSIGVVTGTLYPLAVPIILAAHAVHYITDKSDKNDKNDKNDKSDKK